MVDGEGSMMETSELEMLVATAVLIIVGVTTIIVEGSGAEVVSGGRDDGVGVRVPSTSDVVMPIDCTRVDDGDCRVGCISSDDDVSVTVSVISRGVSDEERRSMLNSTMLVSARSMDVVWASVLPVIFRVIMKNNKLQWVR